MEYKLNIGWTRKLDIAEFPQLMFNIGATISETMPEDINDTFLIEAAQKLLNQLQTLEPIRRYARKMKLTEEIKRLNSKRIKTLRTMISKSKSMLTSPIEQEVINAKIFINWIYEIAPRMPYYSHNRLTRYINIMEIDVTQREEIGKVLVDLDLSGYASILIETNKEFEKINVENNILFGTSNMSLTEKTSIMNEAYNSLRNFERVLSISIQWNGIEEYEELYLGLKKNLGDFHAAYKMRITNKSENNPNDEVAKAKPTKAASVTSTANSENLPGTESTETESQDSGNEDKSTSNNGDNVTSSATA